MGHEEGQDRTNFRWYSSTTSRMRLLSESASGPTTATSGLDDFRAWVGAGISGRISCDCGRRLVGSCSFATRLAGLRLTSTSRSSSLDAFLRRSSKTGLGGTIVDSCRLRGRSSTAESASVVRLVGWEKVRPGRVGSADRGGLCDADRRLSVEGECRIGAVEGKRAEGEAIEEVLLVRDGERGIGDSPGGGTEVRMVDVRASREMDSAEIGRAHV